MRKTVGAMLVTAGLLSSFQLAEAAPDADAKRCEISVRRPIKEGNKITAIGTSAGCPDHYQFRVVLQRRVFHKIWENKGSTDPWFGDASSQKAETPCTKGNRIYRAIIDNITTGHSETSLTAVFKC